MELFFDTETSDKINFKTQLYTDDDFPWVVQLGAVLAEEGIAFAEVNVLVQADGRTISDGAARVHQIDTETADRCGIAEHLVATLFTSLMNRADILVAHNFDFDVQMMAAMLLRNNLSQRAKILMYEKPYYCTMKETTELCNLPGPYGPKWPKLSELHEFLFGEGFVGAHDAMYDIRATMKCFYKLKEEGHIEL